jgi:hypothetical protein
VIARNYGATAAHGFVYDHREGFVFRWKNHEVRGGVDRWELGLIDKPEKADARRYTKSGCLRFKLRTKRAFAGEDQECFRKICLCKSAQEIERMLPGLKFGTEKDDSVVRCGSPAGTDGAAVGFGGMPDPPIVVDGIRSKGDPLGWETEREHKVK